MRDGGIGMKLLIVGAGATGGYLGGRLVEKGEDVTFLVREKRCHQLEKNGLVIKSPFGDARLNVKTIGYGDSPQVYDVIIVAVKSYHIDNLVTQLQPYIHDQTMILPFLNGFAHYEKLINHFGENRVLPGLCFIYSTLNAEGEIIHTGKFHRYVFGEWHGRITERIKQLEQCLANGNFTSQLSDNMMYEVWNKYAFIASMSGITTVFQSAMGPILSNEQSKNWYCQLIKEICEIIQKQADIGADAVERITAISLGLHPEAKSSMLQDMEKGLPIEGEHLHGYFMGCVLGSERDYPHLAAVYSNLAIYEEKRSRHEKKTQGQN